MGCFFAFRDIKESPRKIQNLVIDFLKSKQNAQFALQNALSRRDNEEETTNLDQLLTYDIEGDCGQHGDEKKEVQTYTN